MSKQIVKVPDIGTDEGAEVVEVLISAGDEISVDAPLIVLETEKASVEVPSSFAGKVSKVLVKEGDQLKTGDAIAELDDDADTQSEAENNQAETTETDNTASSRSAASENQQSGQNQQATEKSTTAKTPNKPKSESIVISVPDIGGADDVEVIEIYVKAGDSVAEGDSLIVLESEKASLEVPSTASGTVEELFVNTGSKVKEGDKIARLVVGGGVDATESESSADNKTEATSSKPEPTQSKSSQSKSSQSEHGQSSSPPTQAQTTVTSSDVADGESVYAGPSVRKLARQLGVNLNQVKSSGPRGRYTKDDVRSFVRQVIADKSAGSAIPKVPAIDFTQFGEIKKTKLSKIKRSTAANMHRSWLNVPHVTQFDESDISDLEDYRKDQKAEAEKRSLKLTPMPFLLRACALTLKAEPSFNVSLDPNGEHMIEKQYIHIGMAVDTPAGLLVPVIRDVDKKDIWQLAQETVELATKAREGKLTPREMQGGCFTISSLGAIGGQGFTPIVNTPEVGILGVSKASIKPQWDGKKFVPRTMLPLCLSYDHRAVNGADAGRFLTHLVNLLADVSGLMADNAE